MNGQFEIALEYIDRGWAPIPVPFKEKKPRIMAWQKQRLTRETAGQYFNSAAQNIGVILGPASGGLTDIDLDCSEAIGLASYFLPGTDALFGRASKRNSHFLYYTEIAASDDRATIQFKDPNKPKDRGMLLEIRHGGGDKGAQTVFPGSTHESAEEIRWECHGEPARIEGPDLTKAARWLAAACLFVRYMPGSGSRHGAFCAIGGFLARCGLTGPEVKLFADAITAVGGFDRDHIGHAADAAEAHRSGNRSYGYRTIAEDFGAKVAGKAAEWLGYKSSSDGAAHATGEARYEELDDLVEATKADQTAPLLPEAVKLLAAFKKNNPAGFEAVRSRLKKAGCRVTVLDDLIAMESGQTGGHAPTQAQILLELAQPAELFHVPDGTCFADLDINGHRETWPIRAKGFRRWLTRRYFEETQGSPSSEALQSALNVIEAKAHFDAPERVVHIRVGGLDGRLYLDLGDETWRAVQIDATGWRVVDNPPVRFRRAAGMKPLPLPTNGGSVETLRSFLNVQSDADFVLVVAWALACLRNRGPYPVIVLSGEQGSAKSTFSAILRALLDPNTAPLRALPREDRDLFIAASNGHVLAFDNVSGLPAWISDTLCRLATGGGFAVRQLYTDQDEVLFDAARPVILNGIEDIVTRPDLADRAVFLTLEPIPEECRRPEQELWTSFETERPRILGVLLDAVVEGLKRLPETHLPKLPRMADFALWATACEMALWPAGTFWSAYCGNRDEAVEGVIDADPIAAAVRAVMATRTQWTGTASDLLGALAEVAGERVAKSKTWPDSPRALAGRLRRAATFLRKIGIEISFGREGRARTRTIRMTTTPNHPAPEYAGVLPSASSASSAPMSKPKTTNGIAAPSLRTVANDADGSGGGPAQTVRVNPLKSNAGTAADGADANRPLQSGPEKTGTTGWRARL